MTSGMVSSSLIRMICSRNRVSSYRLLREVMEKTSRKPCPLLI
jgi:hypothetical protein